MYFGIWKHHYNFWCNNISPIVTGQGKNAAAKSKSDLSLIYCNFKPDHNSFFIQTAFNIWQFQGFKKTCLTSDENTSHFVSEKIIVPYDRNTMKVKQWKHKKQSFGSLFVFKWDDIHTMFHFVLHVLSNFAEPFYILITIITHVQQDKVTQHNCNFLLLVLVICTYSLLVKRRFPSSMFILLKYT